MNDDIDEENNVDILERLDGVFETKIEVGKITHSYPENILQASSKGNKIFNSIHGRGRQFIATRDAGNRLFKWSDSSVAHRSRQIVDDWASEDLSGGVSGGADRGNAREMRSAKLVSNALFSWSSSDSYIEAKKRELALRKRFEGLGSESGEPKKVNVLIDDKPKPKIPREEKPRTHRESTTNRLNKVVEREANKFVHARIQLIKTHYGEQMSKQIHERKRKEQEAFLKKLKLKEEEYENSLRSSTLSSNKQGGFFGSLFGFNNTSHSGSEGSTAARPTTEENPKSTVSVSPASSKGKRFSFIPAAVPGINLWSAGSSTDVENTRKTKSSESDTRKEPLPDDGNEAEEKVAASEKDGHGEHPDTKIKVDRSPLLFNEADLNLLTERSSASPRESTNFPLI